MLWRPMGPFKHFAAHTILHSSRYFEEKVWANFFVVWYNEHLGTQHMDLKLVIGLNFLEKELFCLLPWVLSLQTYIRWALKAFYTIARPEENSVYN